jgi:hypothetical protein
MLVRYPAGAIVNRLPEIRVRLEPVPAGETAVPEEELPEVGLRTKLGGDPDWIQGDDRPKCPRCKKEMCFVAQIDSVGGDRPNNAVAKDPAVAEGYMFADGGMIYVFLCNDCEQSISFLQSY